MVGASGGRRARLTVAVGMYVTVAVAAMTLPIGSTPSVAAADAAATVVAKYRERIPELMAEQDVPGLAVALVDGDRGPVEPRVSATPTATAPRP